ncbi:hypothetical protein SeMB42_g07642, partial [Synchytrium endobioticum]
MGSRFGRVLWEDEYTLGSIANPKDQVEVAQKATDVAAAKKALNDAPRDLRQFMRYHAADRYVNASQAQPSMPVVRPSVEMQ